jgi:hypothetical protein
MNRKVKIIAVAKDEAAYLPEWIHHHLYIGVDAIDLYINRTSDNSLHLLDKISKQYPQVNVLSGDWVDTCPPEVNRFIQYITYANAFEQNCISQEYDYLFFLDIDEFWMPDNLEYKIHDLLDELNHPPCVSMQWINQYGDQQPFSFLTDTIKGDLVRNVKSIVHKDAGLKKMSLHHPLFNELGKGLMPEGDTFCGSDGKVYRETLHAKLSKIRKVMIIHRADRSEFEYISLLFRGRPSDNIPLKLNREGMHVEHKNSSKFIVEATSFEKYCVSRNTFFKALDIEQELKKAREFVTQRARKSLDSIADLLGSHPNELKRAFTNVTHPEVTSLLGENLKSKVKASLKPTVMADSQEYSAACQRLTDMSLKSIFNGLKADNVEVYRDLALKIEPISSRVAYKLMLKAKKLRPEGPLINRKLKQFEEKLGYR